MRKLSLSLIIVVLAATVSLGWLINLVYEHNKSGIDESIYTQELKLLQSLASSINMLEEKQPFIDSWNKHSDLDISLFDRDDLPLPDAVAKSLDDGETILLESSNSVEAYIYLKNSRLGLSMTLPKQGSQAGKNQLELLLTLCFYAGITAIILIWLWPLIRNLQTLRIAALEFGQGKLSARSTSNRFSYIKDIETEFNRMAEKIESLVADNKLLSRAVSHDLKTPLARLRFGLDALSDTDSPELRQKYAERVNRDLEDMESLIETLLQYARLDEAKVSLNKISIDLKTHIEQLILKYDQGLSKTELHCDGIKAVVEADPRYLSMLFNNLLSNAYRHADARIEVHITRYDQRIQVSIEDDGPGIAKAEREDAIKPFWRGETARDNSGRQNNGYGMGLAIVARIVAWHDADLEITQSEKLGGARMNIVLAASKTQNN